MKEKIGEYKVLAKAGEGSFGKVYECLAKDNTHVAIKEIDKSKLNEDLFEKLKTEAKISMDMAHPNIVKCFSTLQSSKNFYLVFEFCAGGDLQKYLKDRGFLELKEALYLMKQIRDAYKYLLGKSIIHRDIKLENILLGSREEANVKLSDFGCSKVDPIGQTYCGTPKYMALEIIEEKTQYNYKADLWAIGLCFWELIFGYNHFPFSTKTIEALKADIKKYNGEHLRFPPKPKLPEIFYSFFKSILNISPDLRMDADQFINHPIFSYDPDKKIEDASPPPLTKEMKDLSLKGENALKDSLKANDSTTGSNSADPAVAKEVEGVVKAYNEKLLEIKLTHSTVLSLKEYLGKVNDAKMFSYMSGMCLILVNKAMVKAENSINSLTNKKNLYKLDGFDEFIKYPNQFNKFCEDFKDINEKCVHLDREIYAELMNKCYSDEYLQDVKQNLYHKSKSDVQHFYKETLAFVQANYKNFFDISARNDLEKQLKKILIILKGKITENLEHFY